MPDMSTAVYPLIAVIASLLLLMKIPARLFPAIALVASACEMLRELSILNVKVPVIGAAPLFAAAMVVGGVGSWMKSSSRIPVTAATVVAFVGALRLITRLL